MNAQDLPLAAQASQLQESVEAACGRIAPTWPLDQLIAVNPYWGWVAHRSSDAAAQLGVLQGTRLTAPRPLMRAAWNGGALRVQHLRLACEAELPPAQVPAAVERLQGLLASDVPEAAPCKLPLLADLATGRLHPALSPPDALTHQISQHCAAFFDDGQAQWHPDRAHGLWGSWRHALASDAGLTWAGGRAWLQRTLDVWPTDATAALLHGLSRLPLAPAAWDAYLTGLLLSVNGWASWCAYQRWQARLQGRDDDALVQLLAIRLAWELLLEEQEQLLRQHPAWADTWATQGSAAAALQAAQRDDWLLQHAMELAHQQQIARGARVAPPEASAEPASIQAVFCIDVRSEVFRRALESTGPGIRTFGFAGFFGLPLSYSPVGSALVRPQLPGLLAPTLQVSEEGVGLGTVLRQQRQRALQWRERWASWRGAAVSGFSFVETCGPAYGLKLLARSMPGEQVPARWESTGLPTGGKPRLPSTVGLAATTDLADGILRAMGLTRGFGSLVLLAGHGSRSDNNAHAAGLDCGACGGQAGDINARVLAGLLNDTEVREALIERGIVIAPATHFVAGLHNTTTDELELFDTDEIPAALENAVHRLRSALAQAGATARSERAPGLGLESDAPAKSLLASLRKRANDWSQVRPEWGLANNASFIVAPRQRTRHFRLDGRTFLHDYDWRQDHDLSVLTLIMTAPMVVTNWINLQYHASTVDNQRYGSGNKLLHNVVGGHLGVFEGNGGDLRIGLALQSLHDGVRWRHQPLRLSVFIEAPAQAIEAVMSAHKVVRDLVDNGWLHLLRIDPANARTETWSAGQWRELDLSE